MKEDNPLTNSPKGAGKTFLLGKVWELTSKVWYASMQAGLGSLAGL